MVMDVQGDGGGFEPPSTGVVVFIVFVLIFGSVVLGASLLRRLRRSRSTQRLTAALTRRLGLSTASPATRYPEARPSRHTKRFAGVSVVDANSVVDEVHYARLREFPETLVEVSECATDAASADFSQLEVVTTATSAHSHGAAPVPGGELVSPPRSDDGRTPDMQQLNSGALTAFTHAGGAAGRVSHGSVSNGEPQLQGSAAAAAVWLRSSDSVSSPFNHSPLQDTVPVLPAPRRAADGLGRRIISNISVEDLAAHCAAQQSYGEARVVLEESTGVPGGAASGLCCDTLCRTRETDETAAESPMSPFTFIMRRKVQMARGTRSVRIVEPESDVQSSSTDDAPTSSVSPFTRASPPTAAARMDQDGSEGLIAATRRCQPRTVRREHHRHHIDRGGFILCHDFVPDLASRRARRRQAGVARTRFVFQLKADEDYYGRATYETPPTESSHHQR